MADDPPKLGLSVCVCCYNQEHFIEGCLNSLVAQKTDFKFEILVGDDCSTDGTRLIIDRFARQYSGLVIPVHRQKNLGSTKNLLTLHQMARGRYVAHLDGDDFALPGKLQAQVEYLNLHPECAAVVHTLLNVNEAGESLNTTWPDEFSCDQFDLDRLVLRHPEFGHSSLMYRSGCYDALFTDCADRRLLDFYFYIHLASQGRIGVLRKCLGGYRVGVGISTRFNLVDWVIEALEYGLSVGLSPQAYRRAAAIQCYHFATRALAEGRVTLFKKLIKESIRFDIYSNKQVVVYALRNFRFILLCLAYAHEVRKKMRPRHAPVQLPPGAEV